ncbi:GntR family transcriptional regulator [Mycetocola lacteus]|uniref:GntR family transcriptional regulator n=1 Tax=Mycetocola lacteus TaxID=76637 RepID=A0A3L7AKH3_9MICO|nr:GntR family transcriptional regulator [Mycetocola lacteus]RLP80767.1 GntR family transcriptional regulator [Mycetocola lacteus]RLP84552.1 GntR family transcriptional regulator [Mycetocola lacteus]
MTQTLPIHTRLYDSMIRDIRSGVWKQGEQVPSEKTLAESFGTSRGPVRQALAALRAEGMIVGGRGTPPRVNRVVPLQSFDTFLSFTEWAHELGYVPGHRIIEAIRRQASAEVARDLEIEPDEPVIEIIRLRLLDGAPAMIERTLLPFHIGRHLIGAELDGGSIYQQLRTQGIIPVRARHVIDAVAAHALDAEWLRIPEGAPLLRVRRVSRDQRGAVVECADDRYLPSMSTFVIENSATHRIPLSRERVQQPHPLNTPETHDSARSI